MPDEFGKIYGDIRFDLDEGYDCLIPKLDKILFVLSPDRSSVLRENYPDVLKHIELSPLEDKEFLFNDLVLYIDLSCDLEWTFGPEEEFSVVYGFWQI